MRSNVGIWRLLVLFGLLAVAVGAPAGPSFAQAEVADPYPLKPPETASPRDILRSFERNLREAIRRFQAGESPASIDRATIRALRCLDLSDLPSAVHVDRGWEAALLLLEILGRIELPPDEIPDAAAVDATGLTSWTIPNTEITISRTADGPYAGEFQVSAHTVAQLPAFYERVKHLPYHPGALVGAYEDLISAPGPWLPLHWTTNLPGFAYAVVLGQTLWQWFGTLLTLAVLAAVVVLAYVCGRRVDDAARRSGPRRYFGRLLATLLAIPSIHLAAVFLDNGINLVGTRLFVLEIVMDVALAAAVGWLILLTLNAVGEAIIRFRPGARAALTFT